VSRHTHPVVLVVGTDRYTLVEQFAAEKDALADALGVDGIDEFDGSDVDTVGKAIDAAATPAMFGDARLVVLRDGLKEDTIPLLRRYVDDPSDTATLLISHQKSGSGPRGFNDLVKAVKAAGGHVVEVKGPPERAKDLVAYVGQLANAHGVRLEREAAQHIAAHLGADAGAITSALEQLATARPNERIGVDAAIEFVTGPVVARSWELTDAIDGGQIATALSRLRGLLADSHPLQVQGILAAHVRRLMVVADMDDPSPTVIEGRLGVKSYPAQKLAAMARRSSRAAVEAAHREVARADVALRGATGLPMEAVLEVLVVRLCILLGERASRAQRRSL
jgi:DNA polymerase III delta subunit